MSPQQQFQALYVVLHSHLRGALAAVYPTLCESDTKVERGVAPPKPASYAATLGAAYALTPALLAATGVLARAFHSGPSAVMAGGLLALIPPAIHVAHGATGRAWRAFVWMVGCTVLISSSGAAIGYALSRASCDPAVHGECGLTALAWTLVGAVIGGIVGYCAHALQDVVHHSSVPSPRTGGATLTIP